MKLCIYHGNCADGFGAAWAMWKRFPDTEFVAGFYDKPPPDTFGRDVYLLDFSYKRPVIEQMIKDANSVTILDHHKTAYEELQDVPGLYKILDMERSGAMIAWDYFHHGKEPPVLIQHIQDRDLWRFKMTGTREVQAALFSHPYDFEVWDELMATPISMLRLDGTAIDRKHLKDINELIRAGSFRIIFAGYDVPAINVPYTMGSDAANLLCQGEPFAMYFWYKPDGVYIGMRSSKNGGVDVSEIAKKYGGGGHRNAAAFTHPVPLSMEGLKL